MPKQNAKRQLFPSMSFNDRIINWTKQLVSENRARSIGIIRVKSRMPNIFPYQNAFPIPNPHPSPNPNPIRTRNGAPNPNQSPRQQIAAGGGMRRNEHVIER